ncbi:MAG: PQQ-dependent sugar dehydrogenase [Methylococcaceae bacterium]
MHRTQAFWPTIIVFLLLTDIGRANSWPEITFVKVAENLDQPVYLTHANKNSERLFIVEQPGRVKILQNDRVQETAFLDIKQRVGFGGEKGLFSLAFPQEYPDKRYFYVNYTNKSGNTTISRFYLSQNENIADAGSEEIILTVEQPFGNHNGGQIAFGPDNFLYIGMGDGGSGGDPFNAGQNKNTLLGKLLRIDVEAGVTPYAIPATNPFVTSADYRPEIWALGLRNPWRFSFDQLTGDLYIADVGQNKLEEINVQPADSKGGENYGWNIMEGRQCFNRPTCDQTSLTLPIFEYGHTQGNVSITGGYVYRDQSFPRLQNIYIFGDFASGWVAGLRKVNQQWEASILAETDFSISSFGEDAKGQLYLADLNGALYRIEDNSKLSQLKFEGLLPNYRHNDKLQIFIREINPERELSVDLWVAVKQPGGTLLFFTDNPDRLLSTQPQPFKRQLESSANSHQLIDLLIPDDLVTGTYTFYALYNKPETKLTEFPSNGYSNVANVTTQLKN